MHPIRKRRLTLILLMVGGIFVATAFAIMAFKQNLMLYYTPSEVVAGKAPQQQRFNIGGMVSKGSVSKASNSVEVRFDVTDYDKTISVSYAGILPDLFREGQAVVVKGKLNANGQFIADEVLAKHDENYMPKEVAASLKKKKQQHEAMRP